MDKIEVVKGLEDVARQLDGRENTYEREAIEEAITYIEQTYSSVSSSAGLEGQVEERKGWISVDDRLPDFEGRVIVVYIRNVDICDFGKGQFMQYDDDGDHRNMTRGIKYWMPMPNPPKAA